MHTRHTLAASAIALLAAFPVAAETQGDAVVVTATRFSESDPRTPGNITVITRKDIQNTPAQSIPDVLGAQAGVFISPLSGGSMGRNATVDMRGFGATATSNTLILVDGQRINPVDMGSIIWSSIPLESVERIEVMRGSGTVLFGDGATGGVINIITNKTGKKGFGIAATGGSFGYNGIDINASNSNEKGYFNLFLNQADSQGYRDNGQQDQLTASGRVGLFLDRGELFTDFAIYKESNGLPGSIFKTAYGNDPRSTRTPYNHETKDGYRVRPGVTYQISNALTLEAEVSLEHQRMQSDFVSSKSASDRTRDTLAFTPRLRWQHGIANLPSETVVGFDYYDGRMDSDNTGYASTDAQQKSNAVYAQNVTRLSDALSLTLGARTQRMEQEAHQSAYAPFGDPAMEGNKTRRQSAYDAGLSYAKEGWRVYGKTGTTFRFANLDELFGTDPITYAPVFSGDIKPQHGTISEIGGSMRFADITLRGSLYHLRLEDEIGYNGSKNTNFDPTRRQGAELEATWKITRSVQSKFAYTHTDAEFRSGQFKGKELPLVPKHQANVDLTWDTGTTGAYTAAVRYVGERRFGGDFSNQQGMNDSYTTLDLQAAWNLKPWRIVAKAMNVTDEKYSPFAGYSSTRKTTYYYPADGRSFYLTARYDF